MRPSERAPSSWHSTGEVDPRIGGRFHIRIRRYSTLASLSSRRKVDRRRNRSAFVRGEIDEAFCSRETQARGVSLKPERAFREKGAPLEAAAGEKIR